MKPIIFNGDMVMAILEGRKTQTRRVIPIDTDFAAPYCCTVTKGMPMNLLNRYGAMFTAPKESWIDTDKPWHKFIPSPCGGPGTLLWVRETFGVQLEPQEGYPNGDVVYRADCSADEDDFQYEGGGSAWRPSIHMPHWASRITLEVVSVQVERLQEISEEDARAEGITEPAIFSVDVPGRSGPLMSTPCYRAGFAILWDSIYGPGSWDANPWVWQIEFKVLEVRG